MKTISVSELKARLSENLRLVAEGEEVLVTDRGVPVARLVPLAAGTASHLHHLAAEGKVRLPRARLDPAFWSRPRPQASSSVLAQLLEDREGGR